MGTWYKIDEQGSWFFTEILMYGWKDIFWNKDLPTSCSGINKDEMWKLQDSETNGQSKVLFDNGESKISLKRGNPRCCFTLASSRWCFLLCNPWFYLTTYMCIMGFCFTIDNLRIFPAISTPKISSSICNLMVWLTINNLMLTITAQGFIWR
jgi:hypothetical protein